MVNNYNQNLKESINILEEDNDFLIDSFQKRLQLRIMKIFKDNKITIASSVIENIVNDNLNQILHDINKETCEKFNDFLTNIFNYMHEQIVVKKVDKAKLKKILSTTIDRINSTENKMITPLHFNNFKDAMFSKISIYDNASVNKEIESIIQSSSKDIVKALNENNNEFLMKQIEMYIKFLISNKQS